MACRLLSNPRRSNSRQSCSQRHRSSNKWRRQLQLPLLLLLLRLLLQLLTMMMLMMMTYQSRYVLYIVHLNHHSFALYGRNFICLHNSISILFVMLCQLQGWINQDSTVIGDSDEVFQQVDLERYGDL